MATKKNTPAKSKPRKTTKRRTKKKSPKSGFRQKLLKLTLQLGLIAACLLVFWMIYLNAVVRDLFEGRRFKIPARVYSEAQELYVGAPLRQSELLSLLEQLGYRQADSAFQAGRYAQQGSRVTVYTRGFKFWDGHEPAQRLTIDFNAQSITQLTANNQPILLARLDPLYLGQIYPGVTEDRVLYRLDEMPERLVLGLLLVEDDRFFSHWGVSFRGILRALFTNLATGRATQGGSTLTNQLVKNLYLSPEKTIVRKVNEALMSIILEFHYAKNDILETYLNEVYIGQQGARSINGFGLGAEHYFGTNIQGLQPHQQAMLVGLIKGPSYYNPRRNPERAKKRRDLVLAVWHEQGLLTEQEYMEALSSPLDIATKPGQANYPAFMDTLRRQLATAYRKEDLLAEGLAIFTTLNPVAQKVLELEMQQGLPLAEHQYQLEKGVLQGAAILTRPSTADVLAMVSDRNPKSKGFNRALDAQRPVGSLIKPAVYLAALEKGYTLASPISDQPVTVSAGDGTFWQPKNYDKTSHGEPLLIDALAKSYNQATARLGMNVGLVNVFDVIERLGAPGTIEPVPSVMLGAHGMSPYEVAQTYQTIAGNGFYSPLNLIRAVSHPNLGVIQRFDLKVSKRFEPDVIHLLQAALHETTQSGTAQKIARGLPTLWVAGKTGTTDDNRDAWFAGFTGDRQLVVWVGRDDNKPTPLTGSSGALPIWMRAMAELDPLQERRGVPATIVNVAINDQGLDAPKWCGDQRVVPFIIDTEPKRSLSCGKQNNQQETDTSTWWQKLFGQ